MNTRLRRNLLISTVLAALVMLIGVSRLRDIQESLVKKETVDRVTIQYAPREAELAHNIRDEVLGWWKVAQPLTGLSFMPQVTIDVVNKSRPGMRSAGMSGLE